MGTGEVVWYNTEDGHDRSKDKLGLFVAEGGNKDTVQTVEGAHVKLAYREPSDPNNSTPNDRGKTWWKVV